jgi:hypothetical protein
MVQKYNFKGERLFVYSFNIGIHADLELANYGYICWNDLTI